MNAQEIINICEEIDYIDFTNNPELFNQFYKYSLKEYGNKTD